MTSADPWRQDGVGFLNDISGRVIGAAIEVHRELGPGLLENIYEHCLEHELARQGLFVERQLHLPVLYKGTKLDLAIAWTYWSNNK